MIVAALPNTGAFSAGADENLASVITDEPLQTSHFARGDKMLTLLINSWSTVSWSSVHK